MKKAIDCIAGTYIHPGWLVRLLHAGAAGCNRSAASGNRSPG